MVFDPPRTLFFDRAKAVFKHCNKRESAIYVCTSVDLCIKCTNSKGSGGNARYDVQGIATACCYHKLFRMSSKVQQFMVSVDQEPC